MKVTLRLTKEEHDFFDLPDQFEEELVEDLFKPLKHKKTLNIPTLNHKFRMLKQ